MILVTGAAGKTGNAVIRALASREVGVRALVLGRSALRRRLSYGAFTISVTHSRARGADDGERRRRDASYGAARDSHPVSTIR